MTHTEEARLTWLYKDGEPVEILARQFHVCPGTVSRIAKRNGAQLRKSCAKAIGEKIKTMKANS